MKRLTCDRCNRMQVLDGSPDKFHVVTQGINDRDLCEQCFTQLQIMLSEFWNFRGAHGNP